eukprot:gene18866-22539_t
MAGELEPKTVLMAGAELVDWLPLAAAADLKVQLAEQLVEHVPEFGRAMAEKEQFSSALARERRIAAVPRLKSGVESSSTTKTLLARIHQLEARIVRQVEHATSLQNLEVLKDQRGKEQLHHSAEVAALQQRIDVLYKLDREKRENAKLKKANSSANFKRLIRIIAHTCTVEFKNKMEATELHLFQEMNVDDDEAESTGPEQGAAGDADAPSDSLAHQSDSSSLAEIHAVQRELRDSEELGVCRSALAQGQWQRMFNKMLLGGGLSRSNMAVKLQEAWQPQTSMPYDFEHPGSVSSLRHQAVFQPVDAPATRKDAIQ